MPKTRGSTGAAPDAKPKDAALTATEEDFLGESYGSVGLGASKANAGALGWRTFVHGGVCAAIGAIAGSLMVSNATGATGAPASKPPMVIYNAPVVPTSMLEVPGGGGGARHTAFLETHHLAQPAGGNPCANAKPGSSCILDPTNPQQCLCCEGASPPVMNPQTQQMACLVQGPPPPQGQAGSE